MAITPPTDQLEDRFHIFYIHEVLGEFYRQTLDMFADWLYPSFQFKILTTFDKTVTFFKNQEIYGRKIEGPMTPTIVLNPSGDFEESDRGGKFLWRFPNLAPGLAQNLFQYIYRDDNVLVTPIFSRIKGTMEVWLFLSSFYEYLDVRFWLLQWFGGVDRIVYPVEFNVNIILPSELYNYSHTNPVTGEVYTIDWDNNGATEQIIKTTAVSEHVLPCKVKPWYQLRGLSDGGDRPGTENLPEQRLNMTIDYDVDIPSYITVRTEPYVEKITLNFRADIQLSRNYSTTDSDGNFVYDGYGVETSGYIKEFEVDSTSPYCLDSTQSYLVSHVEKDLRAVYNHTITTLEALEIADESTEYTEVSLPEPVSDYKYFGVNSYAGLLSYYDHYELADLSAHGYQTLRLKTESNLAAGIVIELLYYKETIIL